MGVRRVGVMARTTKPSKPKRLRIRESAVVDVAYRDGFKFTKDEWTDVKPSDAKRLLRAHGYLEQEARNGQGRH